jgi:RNA methyltransferase, TrmH family
MTYISSPQNPKIRLVRALTGRRKEREEARSFVVEGVRLLEEAQQAGWLPQFVLYSEMLSERGMETLDAYASRRVEIDQVPPHLLESLSDTEVSQGVLAVFPYPEPAMPEQIDFLLVADQLRDPGNLGTLMRTASAAGVQALLVTPGTTDPFSPKVVRAGMGAHFYLPVFSLEWDKIDALALKHNLALYVADSEAGQPAWNVDLRRPSALVVGSEAEGASLEAHQHAHGIITIPMPGTAESLNAAVAAGILLYEFVRQRHA